MRWHDQIKDFNPDLKIYYIGYITIKDFDFVKVNSVSSLYLNIDKAEQYIEENNGNKYLMFASTNKSKEVLTRYVKLWEKFNIWLRQ